jgi:hypothetical protein
VHGDWEGVEEGVVSELSELLRKAAQHVMTPAEIYDQRISWIYSEINMKRSDENLTSAEEISAALKLYGIFPPTGAR